MIEARASERLKEKPKSVVQIAVEPTLGCDNQCRDCVYGDAVPREKTFLSASALNRSLDELQDKHPGVSPRVITFEHRGEPIANPEFEGLVSALRNSYPKARQILYHGFSGVESQDEFVKKTKGLDELVLSLDRNHVDALKRRKELSSDEEAFKELGERVLWALRTGAIHKQGNPRFSVQVKLAGSEAEQKELKRQLLGSMDKAYHQFLEFDEGPQNKLYPRGHDLNYSSNSILNLLHDGMISFFIPGNSPK